ncbi:unnamed protein product [Orchesella dallaii]|uniref:Uncharacterized protein n=1 Tax=Orchesella dallaii TaxID=48710 RepID=A0ABP1QUW2_9HEXA
MDKALNTPLPIIPEEDEDLDLTAAEFAAVESGMMSTNFFPYFWNKSASPSINATSISTSSPKSSSSGSNINSVEQQNLEYSKTNWILWSVWDPRLVQFPLFQLSGNDDSSIKCSKKELEQVVNSVFSDLRDEQFDELYMGDFQVLRITQTSMDEGFFPDSQCLEIQAKKVKFRRFESGEEVIFSVNPRYISSFGSLAEIMRGVIMPSDIVIISGGFHMLEGSHRYLLNCDEYHRTQIIRISHNAHKHKIFLSERIIPSPQWESFQFQYTVEKERTRRTVIRHKNYIHTEFCRRVTDTLAYTQNSWDFPMPIVRDVNPTYIFNLLLSPHCKMPSEKISSLNSSTLESSSPCSSSGESRVTEGTETDGSFYSAEIPLGHMPRAILSQSPKDSKKGTPERENDANSRKQLEENESRNMSVFHVFPGITGDSDDNSFTTAETDTPPQIQEETSIFKRFSYEYPATGAFGDSYYFGDSPDPPSSCTKLYKGHCFCICSYLVWLVAFAFMFFIVIVIAIIFVVSRHSDVCPIKLEHDIGSIDSGVVSPTKPPSTSFSDMLIALSNGEGEQEEWELLNYDFRGNEWINENWERVKGWMDYFVQWINENCSLECVVAKFGMWVDF